MARFRFLDRLRCHAVEAAVVSHKEIRDAVFRHMAIDLSQEGRIDLGIGITMADKEAAFHSLNPLYDISHILSRKQDLGYIPHDKSQILLHWYCDFVWEGGATMNAKEAVARRIQALCLERGIAVNTLANMSGVAPSTIYSMLNTKSKNPGIVSIQKICDGLEISVREFFDDPLFENLEPVIQ